MKVCYSALFGPYEELKIPKIITPGWEYIMYTDQDLKSDVWQIFTIDERYKSAAKLNSQQLARKFKITGFGQWTKSIWIDASFIIDCDLNQWWDKYFTGGLCAPKHPLRKDVYEEGLDCIISGRGNKAEIQSQINEYAKIPIPKYNGIISSGILMRENTPEVIQLCEEWWEELRTHSIRDQIAFAKVSMGKDFVHSFMWDYRREKDFIYRKHFNRR